LHTYIFYLSLNIPKNSAMAITIPISYTDFYLTSNIWKKKPRYRTSQRNPREKPAVAKRCCVRCRYELFRRFESATKPLFSSLALRSGVTRRCVSMTTSVSLDRVSCPEGFLSDRETLKERVRERERERGRGRQEEKESTRRDRSIGLPANGATANSTRGFDV